MDPSSPRQEEKLELAVRAAWLYHVAGNTQHEIARKLQISRPTAQRLVAFAFERGLIKVRVNHKVFSGQPKPSVFGSSGSPHLDCANRLVRAFDKRQSPTPSIDALSGKNDV